MILSLSSGSFAQVDRAGLSGTVSDPSGRVLPETQVAAVQISTGPERSIIHTVNTTTPVSPVGSGTPREIQFALRVAF